MAEDLRYLAYGSNLLPRRLVERVPSAQLLGTMELRGWSLRFHKRGQDGSAKCNLIQTRKGSDLAYCAVYQLETAQRCLLDHAEGLDRGYELRGLDTENFGKVFFYTGTSSHIDDSLKPFGWYKALVVAGARYHSFPDNHIDNILAVKTVQDSDSERRKHHERLIESSLTRD